MKKILYLSLILLAQTLSAQKYYTKTGHTEFKASVAAFEPVEAENNSTTVVMNTSNGQVAALLFVKAFRFKIALMEEHFNENYMDSDQYPKATFKGKLKGFDWAELKKGKQFSLEGVLTVRGKEKHIKTPVTIKEEGGKVHFNGSFTVKPDDFDIKIPGIVKEKIAKEMTIDLDYELVKK